MTVHYPTHSRAFRVRRQPNDAISLSATYPKKIVPSQLDFLALYGSQVFNHSDLLLNGLRNGSIRVNYGHESRQLNRSILDIYQGRLEWIRESTEGEYGRAVAADMEDLCAHLAEHPDSLCDFWLFIQMPHFQYLVFVNRDLQVVTGCIRLIDTTPLSEAERAKLWGKM